jgi:hypothetical protein
MSLRPFAVKMCVPFLVVFSESANDFQTLRFVQSLPKRERQSLAAKFKNADPAGMSMSFALGGLMPHSGLTKSSYRLARADASL